MRVRKILVVLMMLALVLGSADVADAKKKRKKKKKNEVPSTLVIESASGNNIAGTVESSRSGCVNSRKVQITRNGDQVASADADSEGQWFTETTGRDTISNGDVIVAKIEKVTVKSKKKKITCGSDSDRFVVGNRDDNGTNGPNGGTRGTETLVVNVTGPGTVNSNPPGIQNCRQTSGDCQNDYPVGDTVQLNAQPDADAEFTGWTGACSGTTQPCTVRMDRDQTVGATFSGGDGGGSSCPADVAAIPTLGPVLCTIIDLLLG